MRQRHLEKQQQLTFMLWASHLNEIFKDRIKRAGILQRRLAINESEG
jgi:hypothetical protein